MKNFKGYVFVFSIRNVINQRANAYEATRSAWRVNAANRHLDSAYAVGLVNGISQGGFRIDCWNQVEGASRRFEFTSNDGSVSLKEMENKDWSCVTDRAGAYRFGQYLVVEFNGRGQFRYVRGFADHFTWFDWVD